MARCRKPGRLRGGCCDDGGPGRRGPQPVLAHCIGKILLVESLPRGLHGGEERRVVQAKGRARALVPRPCLAHLDREPLAQTTRQLLIEVRPRSNGLAPPARIAGWIWIFSSYRFHNASLLS